MVNISSLSVGAEINLIFVENKMKQEENPYREHGIVPGQIYQYVGGESDLLGKYMEVIIPSKEVIDVVIGNLSFAHIVNTKEFVYLQELHSERVHFCLHFIFNVYFSVVEAPVAKTIEPDPYMCDNCGGHMSYVALALKCDKCGKREKGW